MTAQAVSTRQDELDALLAELRQHLLAMEAGRIVLTWHWGKGDARYEVTEFRHVQIVATTGK